MTYPEFTHPNMPQRLRCPECDTWRRMDFEDCEGEYQGVDVVLEGYAVLTCPECEIHEPREGQDEIIRNLSEGAIQNGKTSVRAKFTGAEELDVEPAVDFDFDRRDIHIPGLRRPWNQGAMIPVFFRREVLHKYARRSDYGLVRSSRTSGGVILPSGESYPFGINRAGEVIFWLTDLSDMPLTEQQYMLSENIPSSHDVGSDFYQMQIEVEYADLTAEQRLWSLQAELDDAFEAAYGEPLLRDEGTVERHRQDFSPPLDGDPESVRVAISDLQQIVVEPLDESVLGRALEAEGQEFDSDLGSLKRLELLLGAIEEEGVAFRLLTPLVVLYDLRILGEHLHDSESTEEEIQESRELLDLEDDAEIDEIYEALCSELNESLSSAVEILESV